MRGFLEYVPGDSLLHRMNPVAKLAAAFLLVIACFATSNLALLALVIVLDAVLAVQCKMFRKRRAWRRLWHCSRWFWR